jgi:hypothetical protein
MFRFIRNLFSIETTPEQAARIEAARIRNTAELGDAEGLAGRYGLNWSEYNRAVQVWRQQVNAGTYTGSLESFIASRK